MDFSLGRRDLLIGASSGAAASLMAPSLSRAQAKGPLSPERSLDAYRRTLCGDEGEENLWWYVGDIHFDTPGQSVVPVARVLSIGRYKAGKAGARSFHHHFHEVGVIIDLDTGEPLKRNLLTGAPVEPPLVNEPAQDVDWLMQDDGTLLKTVNGRATKQTLRWTRTSANLLLVETDPTANAFSLAPGDAGAAWKAPESLRTFYAKTSSFEKPGFVPAHSTYALTLKLTPPWLATASPGNPPGDRFLLVRGVGQKSRTGEVVNQDALDFVQRFFPGFI